MAEFHDRALSDQMAMLGGQQAGYAKLNAPQKFTAFEAVDNATSRVAELSASIGALADRLCGSIPTDVGDGCRSAGFTGIFGTLHGNAEDINRACTNMEDALRRIEAALPDSETKPPRAPYP